MLQRSPTLTPSLENLSYILRHREWWPDGFEWNYECTGSCAIGLSRELCGTTPFQIDPQSDFALDRIFMSNYGKGSWWNQLWGVDMNKITPEMVADQLDAWLAKRNA